MPDPTPPTRPAPSKQVTLNDQFRHALTTEAAQPPGSRARRHPDYGLLTETDFSQRQIAQLTGD